MFYVRNKHENREVVANGGWDEDRQLIFVINFLSEEKQSPGWPLIASNGRQELQFRIVKESVEPPLKLFEMKLSLQVQMDCILKY